MEFNLAIFFSFLFNFILYLLIFKKNEYFFLKNIIKFILINILSITTSYFLAYYQINFNIDLLHLDGNSLLYYGLNYIMCSIFYNLLFLKKNIKKYKKLKYLFILLISISISIFIEFIILNYRHYESLLYVNNSKTLKIDEYYNIKKLKNGKIKILSKDNFIEIKKINKITNNLYLNIDSKQNQVKYILFIKDEANKNFIQIPPYIYSKYIYSTKFNKLNASGKLKSIRIMFTFDNYDKNNNILNIKNVRINEYRPMIISLKRLCILIFIIYTVILICPTSKLYKIKLFSKDYKYFKIITILTLIIIQWAIFYFLITSNPFYKNNVLINSRQYNNLAISLSQKHYYLNIKPTKTLKKLRNPYDTIERIMQMQKNKDTYLWDHAYYKGKYYVYFGIVPELLAYYPYYMLTNMQLQNNIYIFFVLAFSTILVYALLYEIAKKYFEHTSFIHYILSAILLLNSSFFLYCAKRPDMYSVPIITGVMFSLAGLFLWFNSIKSNNTINKIKLFAGSCSMALVAGCRPQLCLCSLLAFIIFKDYVKKNSKRKFSIILNIIIALIPYFIVAYGIMKYNYARFNSYFDFGANYNLTTNDMTHRGFKIDRIFLGIYYYLLNPTIITLRFPYIFPKSIENAYQGVTIQESSFGGVIYNNLILIFGLLAFKLKKYFKNKSIYNFVIALDILALIIIIIDTEVAGLLSRYIIDFSWLLFLATSIVIFSISNIKNKKVKGIYTHIIFILFMSSIIINMLLIPNDFSMHLYDKNPELYYKIQSIFEFLN